VEGVAARCADDVLIRLPGNSQVPGHSRGKAEVVNIFLLGGLHGHLPRTVDGLACDDDHGVILTAQSVTRHDGRSVVYWSADIRASG
jgi:hypothetical protein